MSLDGSMGHVYGEQIKTVAPEISGNFETFMNWADEVRRLKVRCNADNPRDAAVARKFGAEGIGLCRTEHMFFDSERIFNFRRMITADTKEKREEAMHILNDPAIQEAKKIALTDSSAKKVTKWLYNLPAPLLLSAVKAGSFVEVKMPSIMALLKRVY